MALGRLLPLTGWSGEETLAWPDGHGGSPRKVLRRRRGNEEKRRTTAISERGDIGRLGSRKTICMLAVEKLHMELQRVDVLVFLVQEKG
jgi:hypothetical protein